MIKVRTAILTGVLLVGAGGIAQAQTAPSTSVPGSSTPSTTPSSAADRPANFPAEPKGNVLFCATAGPEKKCITIDASELPTVAANPSQFVKLPPKK